MSSYAKLGNNCTTQTSALTSNAKYILPFNNVYNKYITQMMVYPGMDYTKSEQFFGKDLEYIKTYNQELDNETNCSCKK